MTTVTVVQYFQKMFCQTIRSGGRLHRWIIDTLIANPTLPAADYLYDRGICSNVSTLSSYYFMEK